MKALWGLLAVIPVIGALLLGGGPETGGSDEAYLAVCPYGPGFLAVGTQGRMESVGLDGAGQEIDTPTDCALLDVAAAGEIALAVGEKGTVLLLGPEGRATALDIGVSADLRCVSPFGDGWLLGGDGGTLLRSQDLETWAPAAAALTGNVVGLAANEERCVGVTDRGEIVTTTDGTQWDLLDYNDYYGDDLAFHGVENCNGLFWAMASDRGGARVLFSQAGGVWAERKLYVEASTGTEDWSRRELTALCGDGQQVIAVFGDGSGLTLPDCSACNKPLDLGGAPLYGAASNKGKVLFAGGERVLRLEDTEAVRQTRIKAAAAKEKQNGGALIIDVRGGEDYAARHIAGSLHLEVDRVEAELNALAPDLEQELIFYCLSGARGQRALETAQMLGYQNVYNLGGIDDWTYSFEGAEAAA